MQTGIKTTAEDVLMDVWRRSSMEGTRPTLRSSADNRRSEIDALVVGVEMLILHGGEFEEGPEFYALATGRMDFGGEFRPDPSGPTFLDSTADATAAVEAWLARNGVTVP